MTKHISPAIALTVTTFLSAPAIAASLTPTLGENSMFSYSEGSENDYNFTLQEADAEGNLTIKYYKIDLKPEAFSTSKNISWLAVGEDQKDATDVVAVQLPNDQVKYFRYTYTQPADYEKVSEPELVLQTITDPTESNTYQSGGVAVSNVADINYGDIKNKLFKDNRVSGKLVNNTGRFKTLSITGGTVYNAGVIGDVEADFIGNSLAGTSTENRYSRVSADGGAIYNSNEATINSITGNFIGNYVQISNYDSFSDGGAIYNGGTIGHITGDFIDNYASAYYNSSGGAIYNSGTIDNIAGNFIGNHTLSQAEISDGGAIYNSGTIDNITGDFIGNYVQASRSGDYSGGGAIANSGAIGDITGSFIGNHASDPRGEGGAIMNAGTVNSITGDFIGNYTQSSGGSEYSWGGAIMNAGIINSITGDFIGNYVQNTTEKSEYDRALARGGAVFTFTNMNFVSGSNTHFMSGNYTKDLLYGKVYNAVYAVDPKTLSGEEGPTPELTFNTDGGGAWVINDNIESGPFLIDIDENDNPIYADSKYNLNFTGNDTIDAATGTTTQYVAMNNDIVNAETVTVEGTTLKFGAFQHEDQTAKNWDGKGAFVAALNEDGTANRDAAAVTSLMLNNAVFDIANGYLETVKLKGYSATDSFMHIDVDPDNMKADELHVAGNVEGVTKLIVHASSNADIRDKGEILFAESENDTTGNEGSFVVSRVYKSPYLFDIKYDQIADNSNEWYFEMNDQPNEEPKEPDVPDVPTPPTPELPDIPPVKPQPLPGSDRPVAPEVIGAESLPAAGLAQTSNMIYNIMQKVSSNYSHENEAFHNLWANAVYNTLRIKTPTDIDAEVWGLEAGGDLQHDLNNKLGLFLSYRKGNYDMNGDGKHHYSTIGSEIDIDSYLAGLYYRYDRNHWWTFATVYGGIQRVDLKTKDGIKSDTDGTEFGGSVELGYDYAINKTVYLTPSVGAFYTQVDYDDATDSAGKIAKYNTLRQLELEAGVKLTKAFVTDEGYANVYVKPSVVRTITDGDEVRITGLSKVDTIDDQTLGRVEIGGRYGFTEQLSAYGWANHTFGDDYKASTFGLGLSYSW